MRDEVNESQYSVGHLPSPAPLANPYVPFQQNNPPRYDLRKGLIRGTLFPGLDLSFMGLVNTKEQPITPLSELQTMSFVLQELALYLDTHKNDTEALGIYRQMQEMYCSALNLYEKKYGPLTHMSQSQEEYQWLKGPWPWEYCVNQEV